MEWTKPCILTIDGSSANVGTTSVPTTFAIAISGAEAGALGFGKCTETNIKGIGDAIYLNIPDEAWAATEGQPFRQDLISSDWDIEGTDIGFSKGTHIVIPDCTDCIRNEVGAKFWNGDALFTYPVEEYNFWYV